MEPGERITPIGTTNFRNKNQPFGIKEKDRMGHIYVIGKTGVGKSTLLLNMAISDIENGNGLAVIDPHGDLSEKLLEYIPYRRIKDVIYFNPADTEHSIAFNPLHAIHPKYHHLVASGLISTFKKIWAESWGPRLEHILRFTLLTLLEYPDATLLDIQPILTNPDFRRHVLHYVENQYTIAFWRNEFDKYTPGFRAEAIAPIINKVSLFQTSIPLRNIVGQKTSSFRMQQVLDEGKILISNLSKGKIGEDACTLIGSVLTTSISLAALYRAHQPEQVRKPFLLFIDEAHSFITRSFADILSEARKYRLGLFMTHQYIDQLHEDIRSSIFGNVGTLISFRIGAKDAECIAKEFYPLFNELDLINLPRYSMYLKLMIDGETSRPFSANANILVPKKCGFKKEIIQHSLIKYSKG
jgi:hypothetical protein